MTVWGVLAVVLVCWLWTQWMEAAESPIAGILGTAAAGLVLWLMARAG